MRSLLLCDDCKPAEAARLCRAHNCGIEIQSFYDSGYPDRNHNAIPFHRELLRDISVRSMHGPFPELNPGATDRMIKLVTANRFQFAANVARQLDISHVVLHHGYVPGTYKANTWIKNFSAFWREFLHGQPAGLNFHIENVFEKDAGLIAAAVAAVEDDRLDICLDVGHAHCFSETSAIEWVRKLRDQIGYVHLHNNHGSKDEHLNLDEGTLKIVEICNELEELAPRALWALEVPSDSFESALVWLSNHGFR